MSKRPLVFIDTETTGLGPSRQAWEVAMVRREPDGTQRSVEFFLHTDVSRAEPGALDIGRYYDRHPDGLNACFTPPPPGVPVLTRRVPAPPREPVLHAAVAAELVAQWTAGATIVGANPAFDVDVLARLLRGNRFEPRWHYRTRDVEAMACAVTGDADLGGLAACAFAMGVPVDPAREHTAMGDVRTVIGIYDAIVLMNKQIDAIFAPALAAEAADEEASVTGEVPASPATVAAALSSIRTTINAAARPRPAYRTETGSPR